MAEVRIFDPSWLREKAATCRNLAQQTESAITAEELREIATEYDADAANFESELQGNDGSGAGTPGLR